MSRVKDGRQTPPTFLRGWAGLTLGLLLLLLFMFVVLPWVQRLPLVRPLTEFIHESGIEAGGLFYTDVEETGDAESAMRDTIRFPPRQR